VRSTGCAKCACFHKKNESVLAEVRIPYISRLLKKKEIRWMKQQQTFNSFQEFQIIKNLKPIAVDVSFNGTSPRQIKSAWMRYLSGRKP
jgi:hypothetical protein